MDGDRNPVDVERWWLIPDANREAYVGLPGVLVWEFERERP